MIWSALKSIQTTANSRATAVLASTAARKASASAPVAPSSHHSTAMAEKAATISSPSRPMLMTPDFSAKIPPIPAKAMGTVSRSADRT